MIRQDEKWKLLEELEIMPPYEPVEKWELIEELLELFEKMVDPTTTDAAGAILWKRFEQQQQALREMSEESRSI